MHPGRARGKPGAQAPSLEHGQSAKARQYGTGQGQAVGQGATKAPAPGQRRGKARGTHSPRKAGHGIQGTGVAQVTSATPRPTKKPTGKAWAVVGCIGARLAQDKG